MTDVCLAYLPEVFFLKVVSLASKKLFQSRFKHLDIIGLPMCAPEDIS